MHHKLISALCVLVLGFAATACDSKSNDKSGDEEKTASAKKEQKQKEQKDESKTGSDEESGEKTIQIGTVGNEFKFDTEEIKVQPGQKVKIVLKNGADQESVKHNFLQLDTNDDDEAKTVADAALKASDNDYVPEEGEAADHLIAASDLAGPGETVEVSFTAPEESGKYKYICTFPGHFPQMQGTLIVE